MKRTLTLAEVQAHHALPVMYDEEFAKLGIDIQQYGAWWEKAVHGRMAHDYNLEAGKFLNDLKKVSSKKTRTTLVRRFIKKQAVRHALTVYILGPR